MSTSVRRYGVTVDDPNAEERFRRIEEEIAKRQLSQLSANESARRRLTSATPRVQGVRINRQIVGGLAVEWNPVDMGGMRYTIEASTDPGFRSVIESETTTSTHYTFRGLDPDTTYYVRVQATNSRGEPGPYGEVLNTQTGQATYTNLESGAASGITTVTQTSGFTPALLDASATIAKYLQLRIAFPKTCDTFIVGVTKADIVFPPDTGMYIRVLVDGDTKIEYENANTHVTGSQGTVTIPGLMIPILLGQGSHTFGFEVELFDLGGGYLTLTPKLFTMAVWQARN